MKRKLKSILVLGLPYILSVLLPIISVLCLGRMVTAGYQEKIISDRQKNIEFVFERFLQRINNIETLTQMIAQNDIVTEYTYASLRGVRHSVEETMQMRDLLSGYMSNSDVTAMYFYDPVNHRIITTDAVFSEVDNFFKYKYRMEGYTLEECVERLNGMTWGYEYSTSIKVNLDAKSREVIEYVVSVPLNLVKSSQPHLIVTMETEDIFGDFYDMLEDGGEFYLYNNDQLIFSSDEQYEEIAGKDELFRLNSIDVGNEKIYYMKCRSLDKLWRFEIYMPNLLHDVQTEAMANYVWLLIGIPVVVSIVFCIYFTLRNHRQLRDVLNLFNGYSNGDDENEIGYKALREYANKIIDDNERFRERITKYDSQYKYEVLDKILRNTFVNREEMEKALKNTDICIRDEKCQVLCFRYEDASYRTFITENIVFRDLVKEFLEKSVDVKSEIFDISARETICVLAAEDSTMEVCIRNLLSRLNVEVLYKFGGNMQIGTGNVVDSIYYINNSYIQAKEVIRYSEISENKLLFFSELECLEDVYYFPRETGDKLYNNVVAGRVESAKEIITSLYVSNFEQNSRLLSMKAIEIIKSRLRDCVISIAEKYNICVDEQILLLHEEQNINKYFDIVCEAMEVLSTEIRKKGEFPQNNTVQKIVNYINENYCDNALSLKQISQQLGLHETYISKVFKEEYGENLSVAIEKLRIEKAAAMIKNTDMKINDIAEQVGYTSALSFRRAFKKITGVTPGDYREID